MNIFHKLFSKEKVIYVMLLGLTLKRDTIPTAQLDTVQNCKITSNWNKLSGGISFPLIAF
jgi:hypothetical protein